ncbi:MAG: hypothetical protein LBQ43_03265 [Holosporales bacterium]|jgi:hypothetical protein|nr:hypothetical protein [Holosporales bacterium]
MSNVLFALPLEAMVLSLSLDMPTCASSENSSDVDECSDVCDETTLSSNKSCAFCWKVARRLKGRPRWRERGCHEIRGVPKTKEASSLL